jgi:hypothetical protein
MHFEPLLRSEDRQEFLWGKGADLPKDEKCGVLQQGRERAAMAVHLFVKELKPGMVLAEPVGTKDGQKNLPPGTKLTPQHVTALNTWEIESVTIADDEGGGDSRSADEIRLLAIKQVNGRMRWKPSRPIEEEIWEAAVQRAEHLFQGKKEE